MTNIRKRFPGRTDGEIYQRVHELMEHVAAKFSLDYRKDDARKRGEVSKMGVTGSYAVRGEEVVIDLKFPMLVPGSMRQKVQDSIERKLDGLFA